MKDRKISSLLLERYVLEEVTQAEKTLIEQAISTDPSLLGQIEEIKRSNTEILDALPPALMAHQISEKARTLKVQDEWDSSQAHKQKKPLFKWLGITAPILAASMFFFLLFPESTREKGIEPHLVIYQKKDNAAVQVSPGQILMENDVLQIAYVAGGAPYGVIFSIDGKGVITFHHPPNKGQSTRIESQQEHLLAQAYKLDNAPYYEKFFLVTSRYPIPLKRVQAAAQALAVQARGLTNLSLTLPPYLEQSSLLVLKQEK